MLLVRLLNPIVWLWPGRSARKLYSFAHAEAGSLLDLRRAARNTESPERAALYLRHANDEARHTDLFAQRANELLVEAGAAALSQPVADYEALFDRLGEKRFLAFVHMGEARAVRQFECYRRYFEHQQRDRDARLFAGILSDERRHASYTYELLVSLCEDEAMARRELSRAARWQAWRKWRRMGRALSGRLFTLSMLCVYVLALPLAVLIKVGKRAPRGWRRPS